MLATALPPVGSLVLLATIPYSAAWLRAHHEGGLVVFVTVFALCGGFALLPTYTPAVLGGWVFGAPAGLAATLAGFAGAAAIGFALARHVAGERLAAVLGEHPRGLAIHDAFVRSGFLRAVMVVVLVRLPPSSPFALTNVLLASSAVRFVPFLVGTVVGIAPRAAAAVAIGAGVAQLDLEQPERSGQAVIGIAVTLGVLGALGWLASDALRRLERGGAGTSP